jgi:hypothetical protein
MTMNPADLPCAPAKIAKGPEDARYVEDIMEHAFLSEVLQHCWFILHRRVEVIRPDVDAGGYDLVLEANERIRHVQLKSRWGGGASTVKTSINSRLRDHLDPCVVSISWQADPKTCLVTLRYRYSERSMWPKPVPGATDFELKGANFLPDALEIPALVDELFRPVTPLPRA